MKRFLALALCALLVFSCAAFPVSAAAPSAPEGFDDAYFDGLALKAQALREKLDACALAGIPTDYEQVYYDAFVLYAGSLKGVFYTYYEWRDPQWVRKPDLSDFWGKNENSNNITFTGREPATMEELAYYYNCLDRFYNEAAASLDALLAEPDPAKRPLKNQAYVPLYATGPTRISGQSVLGTAKANGVVVDTDRPLFFIGYGGYEGGFNNTRRIFGLTAYGVDSSMEWGPIAVPERTVDYETITADPAKYLRKADYALNLSWKTADDASYLMNSASSNLNLVSMVSPHHLFHELILKWGIDEPAEPGKPKYGEQGFSGIKHVFLHFDISSPGAREVIADYTDLLMSAYKNTNDKYGQSLHSMDLTNETMFHTWRYASFLTPWREFLRDRYGGDIGRLNSNLGTSYKSFETIPFPDMGKPAPVMIDLIDFNDAAVDDFHRFMVDEIRKVYPDAGDLPIHTKVMDYYSTGKWEKDFEQNPVMRGADHEKIARYTEINGCDAWRTLSREWDNPLDQAFDPVEYNSKSMWYDMLRSGKDAPVYNTEDHISIDDDPRILPEFVPFLISDLWMGAVHGRALSTAWVWQNGDPGSMYYHCPGWRPDMTVAMAHTSLDLNRLAFEVTALQNAPADVAVLYSKSSHVYDYRNVTETMYDAYQYATLSGQRVDFVTENDIAEKLGNYKMLILPKTSRVTGKAFEAIRAFQNQGGSVVIIGLDSLCRDEYNHARGAGDILSVYAKAALVMPSLNVKLIAWNVSFAFAKGLQQNKVRELLAKSGLYNVALTDMKTGRPVAETEWFKAGYEGKTIINMCNFNWNSEPTVKVSIDGRDCGEMIDLITGESFDGSVTLKPFLPRLIQVR